MTIRLRRGRRTKCLNIKVLLTPISLEEEQDSFKKRVKARIICHFDEENQNSIELAKRAPLPTTMVSV
jgi:hypothetical protein